MDSSIAGSPSFVAGIFTNRFGRSTRSRSRFASSTVPWVSWARLGSTSSETQPSRVPEPSWWTAFRRSHAFWMSRVASWRKTSLGSVSSWRTSRSWSSYSSPSAIALWKIVGFDVTPRTPWSISPWRSPFSTNSRDRKSIHTLWPCSASCSSGVVAMPDLLTRVGLHAQFALPGPAEAETRRVRLPLRSGELSQPVRDGLLIAARLPPQGGPGLAGADGVGARATAGPRGRAGGGSQRRRGFGPAVRRSFRKQGHRAEPYMRWRVSSTPFRPPSDFVAFRTGQSPANRRFPTFWRLGVSYREMI